MTLFFVLAGWSTAAAFESRTPREYRAERVRKLLVPLALGSMLLVPGIRWVELQRIDGIDQSFLAFLPTFFTDLNRFSWSHLWFLAYLFAFSVALAPVFRRITRGQHLEAGTRHLVGFVAILAVAEVALRHTWPGYQNLYNDWANVAQYGLSFTAGFLIGRFPQVDDLVDRNHRVLGLIGLAAALAMIPFWSRHIDLTDDAVMPYVAYEALGALVGAGIVAALLGLGRRHLRGGGRISRSGRRYAFPIYVLHQAVAVTVAVHVIDRADTPWLEFAVVLTLATTLSIAAAIAASRFPILDPLFGRPRRHP